MHTDYKQYFEFIKTKFNQSEKKYQTIFPKGSNPESFLMMYEEMNVYPTFPRPIVLPLKDESEQFIETTKFSLEKIDSMQSLVDDKLVEFDGRLKEYQRYLELAKIPANTEKIRRYFDYEIRDTIQQRYHIANVTNGWVKMYELLNTFELLNKQNQINSFHVCEHPGKFVFAIKDYIKRTAMSNNHQFVFQSLNPQHAKNKNAFKVDKILANDPNGILDYGSKKTGDITDPDNIRYYIKTYKNRNFQLITSDCGEDYSKDFTKQETGLYPLYLSAFIIAIGLAHAKTNYVFKLFSFAKIQTICLLYYACKCFKKVYIVRLMTTKGNSGENYCVCLDFNYPETDKENLIDKLLSYLLDLNSTPCDRFDEKFIDRINKYHDLLSMRRIVSINYLIFRMLNKLYLKNNNEVMELAKKYVDYYTQYFLHYIKFD